MIEPSDKVKAAVREYIDGVKNEAWYNPELDDIILDAFWEGVLYHKYQHIFHNENDKDNND